MVQTDRPIIIASRGSALALAQANLILAQCRAAFPARQFELKIIKTTGDKLQTASLAKEGESLPKGLFTKELEVALLQHQADIAVHSLKDLPTELPTGLTLGAVGKREDARDVLIYRAASHLGENAGGRRGFGPKLAVKDLPREAVVATSSTRRKAQLLALRSDLKVVEVRGNVVTRLEKLSAKPEFDATTLAAAGLARLHIHIGADGTLSGEGVPEGLLATVLDPQEMLPCVGQGALGIETRAEDPELREICVHLNHPATEACVTAERAFLAGMGGGCQSPVAAFGELQGDHVRLRAVSFRDEKNVQRGEATKPVAEAAALGRELAVRLAG